MLFLCKYEHNVFWWMPITWATLVSWRWRPGEAISCKSWRFGTLHGLPGLPVCSTVIDCGIDTLDVSLAVVTKHQNMIFHWFNTYIPWAVAAASCSCCNNIPKFAVTWRTQGIGILSTIAELSRAHSSGTASLMMASVWKWMWCDSLWVCSARDARWYMRDRKSQAWCRLSGQTPEPWVQCGNGGRSMVLYSDDARQKYRSKYRTVSQ